MIMHQPDRIYRALVSVTLAVLLTAGWVGTPLLDLGRDPGRLAVSSESTASYGAIEHDHGVCLQYGATAWSLSAAASVPEECVVREATVPGKEGIHADGHSGSHHQPRAPPVA